MPPKDITSLMLSRLDKIDAKLDRIEIQTTKTNGRVDGLEHQRVKDNQHFDALDSRIAIVEKAVAVDTALHGRNSRMIDLVGKFGPWTVVIIMFFLQLGLTTGVIG